MNKRIKSLFFLFLTIVCTGVHSQVEAAIPNTEGKHALQDLGTSHFTPWKNLLKQPLKQLYFGKTTEADFLKIYPEFNKRGTVTTKGSMKIYSWDIFQGYIAIDFGFSLGRLKWIDCIPKSKITVAELMNTYGNPKSINKHVSKFLVYYDYDHLTVTVSKKTSLVHSITILNNNDDVAGMKPVKKMNIPNWSVLNKSYCPHLSIGQTTEKEFIKIFPYAQNSLTKELHNLDLPSDSITHQIMGDSRSVRYEITQGVDQFGYKKIEFFFENGTLMGIDYVPTNLKIHSLVKAYGNTYVKDTLDSSVTLYNYNTVVVAVLNETDQVLSITQALTENFSFANDIPNLEKLIVSPSLGQLRLNKTTENQFIKLYPDLIYNKKTMPDKTVLYAVTQGIVGKNLSSVILVFKDNVLNSVEFCVNKKLLENQVIKMYGNPIAKDSESDPDYVYFDYDQFIVAFDKKSGVLATITLL